MNNSIAGSIGLVIVGGLAWLVLNAGGISHTAPLDWIIGLYTLVWLIVIVTGKVSKMTFFVKFQHIFYCHYSKKPKY
jgi:hypothetical protein